MMLAPYRKGVALSMLLVPAGCPSPPPSVGAWTTGSSEGESGITTNGGVSSSEGSTSRGTESPDEGSAAVSESSTAGVKRTCDGWWDERWSRRRTLSIASTGLADPLTDAILLLRLTPDRIEYAETRPNGDDLRFVLGDEVLAHDVDRWNPDGESVVWIRVPQVHTHVSTEITMYYGSDDMTETGADPASTWIMYESVHHLQNLEDSTANDHDALIIGDNNLPTASEGLVAGAFTFNGDDDFLTLPDESAFDFQTSMMLEVLLRVDAFEDEHEAIVTKGDYAWRLQRSHSADALSFNNDVSTDLDGDIDVAGGKWHYVAATYDGGVKRLFVDGQEDESRDGIGSFTPNDEPVMFGGNATYSNAQPPENPRRLAGGLDEIRISAFPRPPDYFAWQWRALTEGVATVGSLELCEM